MTTNTMAGRFKLEAGRADGSRRMLADWFDNLILDNGLNRIGTLAPLARCQVGTGSAAPVASQTALASSVATTAVVQASVVGNEVASGYHYARITYRFAAGEAAGNLNEVGVGFSNDTLFSRALILDALGQPTTVTVLGDEFLDVTYELRSYWPTGDVTGTITLDGQTYNYVLRASLVGGWTNLNILNQFGFGDANYVPQFRAINGGTLGPITDPCGGSALATLNGLWSSYVENSLARAFAVNFGLNDVTTAFDKIEILTTYSGFWKMQFTPAIPKTSLNSLTLNMLLSWARRSI